jgi:hypothetical protein
MPGRHRRRAVLKRQSPIVRRQAGRRISRVDVMECLEEAAAEVADAGESLPELLVQVGPGDELGLAGRDPVQPLGKPYINVEGHRRRRQGGDSPMVEGNGVLAERLEIRLF